MGAGEVTREESRRPQRDVIPPDVVWVRDAVAAIEPDTNLVITREGQRLSYDYLVVATGIQADWNRIEGLEGQVGRHGIVSIYGYEHVDRVREALQSFQGGTAVFTMPATPIKCAGAPQKIMYLADDIFRRNGVRDRSEVVFASAGARIFGVEAFARTLNEVVRRRKIGTRFRNELRAVIPEERKAVFDVTVVGDDGCAREKREQVVDYDLLHVVPPMSAPDFLKGSALAVPGEALGWVDVDASTLQHRRYPNVFSLGDSSSLPTSRTGAAVRKEAPVLVHNLLVTARQGDLATEAKHYNGYSSCPLITGFGRLVLAEFDYEGRPTPSFPIDTTQERWSMYQMKKHFLPFMYWNMMLRGREV